jgi:integrase
MPQEEPEQLTLFNLGPDMAKLRKSAALLKRANRAPATLQSYGSDWSAFERWCVSTGREALPAGSETLSLYVTARLGDGLKVSSIERHVAAVAYRHRTADLPVPDRTEARAIMEGARRTRKESPRQRAALTPAALRKICNRLLKDGTPAAARDRALLTLGFATGLRRSNLAALDLKDITTVPRKGITVLVRSSKTDQTGKGMLIGVHKGTRPETCPVQTLRAWLKIRGQADGPLLTRMRPKGPTLERLNPETINVIVKTCAQRIGLDPTNYGGHSLRAGFVTAADANGASTISIMARTGHKSLEMVKKYLRNADPFGSANPLKGCL